MLKFIEYEPNCGTAGDRLLAVICRAILCLAVFAMTKRVLPTQTPNSEEDAILANSMGDFSVERFRKSLGVGLYFRQRGQLFERALRWPIRINALVGRRKWDHSDKRKPAVGRTAVGEEIVDLVLKFARGDTTACKVPRPTSDTRSAARPSETS